MIELSNETISILKNFAAINSNIVINHGNVLKTISEAKNIYARALIEESFPTTFGIYDLNEFLSVLGLFEAPCLRFSDTEITVCERGKTTKVRYVPSEPDILTHPQKDIKMPEATVEFDLSREQINTIRKAASTLGVSEVVIQGSENGVIVSVTDTSNPSTNSFDIEYSDISIPLSTKIVYNINNWKLYPGDYTVSVSDKLISQFVGEDVEYFIALEKTSTF